MRRMWASGRARRLGDPGGPSRTSQAIALTRAGLVRPHTPGGDPQAQARLCVGLRTVRLPDLLPSLAARTRFFDDQVLAAISAGLPQVVILGAGYDDRALRFRSPGVRFFELDHPATQADKASRLAVIGASDDVVLATADFTRDDAAAVLAGCGHAAAEPSLFLCEGLLVYLDQQVITRLLAGLRAAAAPGSSLAASLAIHPDGADSRRVTDAANAGRRTGRTEPWRTILPVGAQLDLLRRSGWQHMAAIDAAELEPDAPPGRSLLVTASPAVPEHA
jgi:methyltransferase (TIGR00027 family)